jgi:hypothetical protein
VRQWWAFLKQKKPMTDKVDHRRSRHHDYAGSDGGSDARDASSLWDQDCTWLNVSRGANGG